MKVITDFFTSIGEERAPGQIPPQTLTVLWLDSSCVYSKKDGTEYEPDSLGSMYNSLDRHLRDMQSPIRYVLTFLSFKIGIVNIENNIMSAEQHVCFRTLLLGPRQVLVDTRPIVITLSVHTFCRTITHDPMASSFH